jgi:protein TonB
MGHRSLPSLGSTEEFPAEKEKSKTPMFIGILIAVAVLGVGAYFFLKPSATTAPAQKQTAALTPEQQKLRDSERARLQQEAQAAQEEAKKKDDQLKELQAKLDQLLKAQKDSKTATTTPQIDPAAIQKLQQQAKELEEERKRQEALAAAKLRAAAEPPAPAVTQPEPAAKQPDARVETVAMQNPPGQNQPVQEEPVKTEPASQKQETTPAVTQPQPAVTKPAPEPAAPTFREGDVVEMAPDVVKPELINRVQPGYPPVARKQKVTGTVILSLLISDNGEVSEVKILREAGGSAGLNEAAVAAARKWKFRPAVKQGKRVKVWVTYPVSFKLEG